MHFDESMKRCAQLTSKLLTAMYKSKVIKFKLEKDPLHHRVYFLSFVDSLKIVLSKISETYMLLMDCPSIRRE